jgi:RES domain-containing protein
MLVYRIAKSASRAQDLSGYGAFRYGGRWNSKGTYMLYTSVNSSLAYLETLVHFDEAYFPPQLYIASLQIPDDDRLFYQLPDKSYPKDWLSYENPEKKLMGDQWMRNAKYLGFSVRSAVNPYEYNFLLNPSFPDYQKLVTIESAELLRTDARLR